MIAVNADGNGYTQHYFDCRGVGRIYEMTFDGSLWTLVRGKPDFTPLESQQRFIGTFEDNGQTIRGQWEIDHGGGWELDFHLGYRKTGRCRAAWIDVGRTKRHMDKRCVTDDFHCAQRS